LRRSDGRECADEDGLSKHYSGIIGGIAEERKKGAKLSRRRKSDRDMRANVLKRMNVVLTENWKAVENVRYGWKVVKRAGSKLVRLVCCN
jgi:hypothetical protein